MLLQAPNSDGLTAVARPLVGAALTYFIVNTGLVARAVALRPGNRRLPSGTTIFSGARRAISSAPAAAALAAWAVQRLGFWVAPLTFAPIYLTYRTYKVYMGRLEAQRHVQETSDLHLATIEALAGAIDAKDQMTQLAHPARAGLRRRAGRGDRPVGGGDPGRQDRGAAARHRQARRARAHPVEARSADAGGIPESPHPSAGRRGNHRGVPFPYPVAPLILCHHERWDGKGYPQGLAGEGDSDRRAHPHHRRLLRRGDDRASVSQGAQRARARSLCSKHEAGRALDPTLVAVFVELLPVARRAGERPTIRSAPDAEPAPSRLGSTAARGVPSSSATAFENIALAHREIYALYEIAQSMGTSLGVSDTMALISSKLSKIVPWSGCALFLQQPDTDVLNCRFAAGVDAPRLLDATIRVGEGLSGWVARNRRTLVNASPRVEFEAAGVDADIRAALGDRLPAVSQRRVHRLAGAVPRRGQPLHRRSSPPARAASPNRPAP